MPDVRQAIRGWFRGRIEIETGMSGLREENAYLQEGSGGGPIQMLGLSRLQNLPKTHSRSIPVVVCTVSGTPLLREPKGKRW